MIAVGRVAQLPRRQVIRVALVLGWLALIFALSSRSSFPQPRSGFGEPSSVVVHLILYGVLAVLLFRALTVNRAARWSTVAIVVAFATLYGISDELHQSFVPGRSATVLDVVVDGIGAALAACACLARQTARRRPGRT